MLLASFYLPGLNFGVSIGFSLLFSVKENSKVISLNNFWTKKCKHFWFPALNLCVCKDGFWYIKHPPTSIFGNLVLTPPWGKLHFISVNPERSIVETFWNKQKWSTAQHKYFDSTVAPPTLVGRGVFLQIHYTDISCRHF